MDAATKQQHKNTGMPVNVKWFESQSTAVITAIIAVLLTILLFTFFILRKKVKRQGILLMGLSESGKTLIFARLVYEKFVQTNTSMKENVSDYKAGNKTLQLIDVPGQERVRGRIFDRFKATARGIVFVIDSGTVQKELSDVAEYLHGVLADQVIYSNQPPVLILCNKQDEALGKSAANIQTLLEKELNIVRETKASQKRLTVDEKFSNITLGDPSKPFEFDDLSQKITFAESSALMSDEDTGPSLEDLEDWLSNA